MTPYTNKIDIFLTKSLASLFTNFSCTKNEIYSDNYNMDIISDKISWTDEILLTNLNYTKNKSYGTINSKNHLVIIDRKGVKKLLSENLRYLTDNCDIDGMGDEMIWIKKILQTNFNLTKSKSYTSICDKCSHNISDEMNGKELELDDL